MENPVPRVLVAGRASTPREKEIEEALRAIVMAGEFAIAETDAHQRYCEVPKDAIRAGRRALNMKVA